MRGELSPDQLQKLAVLLQAKGRNGYEYLSRPLVRVCPNCGEVFEIKGTGRRQRFCCVKCRRAYHDKHPDPSRWKATRMAVCPYCGKEFQATREGLRRRKYCSHRCANMARAERRKRNGKESVDP